MAAQAHIIIGVLFGGIAVTLVACGVSLAAAVARDRASPPGAAGGPAAPLLVFLLSLAALLFALPFAAVARRWIASGSWEIIFVEILLFSSLFVLTFLSAGLARGRMEGRGRR